MAAITACREPHDRARLEQLGRYLLRPPLAQDRVRLRADGRLLVELKTVWRDGTSHLLFEPIEFLEKLAAIIPRPAVNLLIYRGVLGPHARTRSPVVRYGRPAPDPTAPETICDRLLHNAHRIVLNVRSFRHAAASYSRTASSTPAARSSSAIASTRSAAASVR